MGHKEKLIDGAEVDLVFAKNILCYLNRARVSKKIKRKINKRIRKESKNELSAMRSML